MVSKRSTVVKSLKATWGWLMKEALTHSSHILGGHLQPLPLFQMEHTPLRFPSGHRAALGAAIGMPVSRARAAQEPRLTGELAKTRASGRPGRLRPPGLPGLRGQRQLLEHDSGRNSAAPGEPSIKVEDAQALATACHAEPEAPTTRAHTPHPGATLPGKAESRGLGGRETDRGRGRQRTPEHVPPPQAEGASGRPRGGAGRPG